MLWLGKSWTMAFRIVLRVIVLHRFEYYGGISRYIVCKCTDVRMHENCYKFH